MLASRLSLALRRRGQFSLGGLGHCASPGSKPCCAPAGTKICVTTCSGLAAYNYTVELFTGATLIDSCVTDATGCCTLNDSGTFTVKILNPSGTLLNTSTRTLSGTTITIPVTDSAIVCCAGYAIPEALHLTDGSGFGTVPFGWTGTAGGISTWYGCVQVTEPCYTVNTPSTCGGLVLSTQAMLICYIMTCNNAGSSPHFALQRSWGWVFDPSSNPAWYNGGTPIFPCTSFQVGCSAAPPPACGSPHTDTASDGATPTSTAPFMISFTVVDSGSNFTADPIASGSVAISA